MEQKDAKEGEKSDAKEIMILDNWGKARKIIKEDFHEFWLKKQFVLGIMSRVNKKTRTPRHIAFEQLSKSIRYRKFVIDEIPKLEVGKPLWRTSITFKDLNSCLITHEMKKVVLMHNGEIVYEKKSPNLQNCNKEEELLSILQRSPPSSLSLSLQFYLSSGFKNCSIFSKKPLRSPGSLREPWIDLNSPQKKA